MARKPGLFYRITVTLGLRDKFLLIILSAVTIPLLISFFTSVSFHEDSSQRYTTSLLEDKTKLLNLLIQSRQISLTSAASTLAQDNLIVLNLELGLHQSIDEYLLDTRILRDISSSFVIATDGTFVASGGTEFPENLKKAVLNLELLNTSVREGVVKLITVEEDNGEVSNQVVNFHSLVPIKNAQDNVLGFVVASYALQEEFRANSFYSFLQRELDIPFFVLGTQGCILQSGIELTDENKCKLLENQSRRRDGAPFYQEFSASPYILSSFSLGYDQSGGELWFVIAHPEFELLAARNQALFILVVAVFAAWLFGISLAVYFANHTAEPIAKIESQAKIISEISQRDDEAFKLADNNNETTRKIEEELKEVRQSRDEVGKLANEFIIMATSIAKTYSKLQREINKHEYAETKIRELNKELETRVENRTEELSIANSKLRESLSDLRNTQNHLIESEKMAALGNLVAGMAHEINTPLGTSVTAISIIKNKTEELYSNYRKDTLTKKSIEDFFTSFNELVSIVEGNLDRAASQISFFKQVSIDQEKELPVVFNLSNYIDDLLNALKPSLEKSNILVLNRISEEVEIESFPSAIYQIFTNIFMNSVQHAFPGDDRGEIIYTCKEGKSEIEISITDNGRGMTEETKRHIFEPFFTTRRGQGATGLGLAIVYSLVNATCGGKIVCESKKNQGTKFIITLPKLQK